MPIAGSAQQTFQATVAPSLNTHLIHVVASFSTKRQLLTNRDALQNRREPRLDLNQYSLLR